MYRKNFKYLLLIWSSITIVFWAWGARAEELEKLLSKGELVVIEKPDESGRQFVTGMVLIEAPIDRVWDVVTDFDHYDDFMPQTNGVKIIKKTGDELEVDFNLKFRFSIVSTKIHYILKHKLSRPNKMTAKVLKGDFKDMEAEWEFTPAKDGKATIASYRHYSDLTSLGVIVKYLLSEQPQLGAAIAVSTSALVVKAVKARAEAPPEDSGY